MNHQNISEYFFRAKNIVERFNPHNIVILQFYQRQGERVLGGMSEVLWLLHSEAGGKGIVVRYLADGKICQESELVLEIEGPYQIFGYLEGLIDGILSRAASIATNARDCINSAAGKEVIFFADRSDHFLTQARDGLSSYLGGITSFSSFEQTRLIPRSLDDQCVVYGSIPHALIQNFSGDLLKTMEHYYDLFPHEPMVALVDFSNDVIADSLRVLKHFGDRLYGVRVDTSKSISDFMFQGGIKEYGVSPNQIKKLRAALDENGGEHLKITVSSGFNPSKIHMFEQEKTPVDAYGVGEFLLKVNTFFCGDVISLDGKECAKYGRNKKTSTRLIELSI